MDFTLFACAKFICRNGCSYRRIAAASALGACFAIVFPLFGLSGAPAIAVKILSGLALASLAGRFSSFKGWCKFSAAFMGISFLLGGALIAVFSLAGISYNSGGGYIISSVPVGIPAFAALCLVLACRYFAKKFTARHSRAMLRCVLYVGGKSVEGQGFFDSGNRVYCGGQPVSVIPLSAACALVDVDSLSESVKVHTVAGSRRIKIFTADKLEIYNGKNLHTIKCVKIGISPRGADRVVLHPDLSEEN